MPARALILLVATLLTACSAGDAAVSDAAEEVAADVVVELTEMAYRPGRLEVPAGRTVTVHLVNRGALRHNLVLPGGSESPTLHPGEATTVDVGPLTGDGTAWCSVPGHRNAGMQLDLVVTR